jgi:hypothetical protein
MNLGKQQRPLLEDCLSIKEPANIEANIKIGAPYIANIRNWYDTHECKNKQQQAEAVAAGNTGALRAGAFGGDLSYIVTPGSVGATLDVRCSCGAVPEDVTDLVNHW